MWGLYVLAHDFEHDEISSRTRLNILSAEQNAINNNKKQAVQKFMNQQNTDKFVPSATVYMDGIKIILNNNQEQSNSISTFLNRQN